MDTEGMGSGSGLSIRQLNRIIKKIHIEPGTVLVIKEDSEINHNLKNFTDMLEKLEMGPVIVLIATDLDDIIKAPPEAMRKAGWYRMDDLATALRKRKQ